MSFYPDESARTKLEQIPKVELFCKRVKELKNQKVLSMSVRDYDHKYAYEGYDGSADYIETGIISGPPSFHKMHVFVPIKQKFILKKDSINWELDKSKEICAPQKLFQYLDTSHVKANIWAQKSPKRGSIIPEVHAVYLGNEQVEIALRPYQERKVTRMEKITGLNL